MKQYEFKLHAGDIELLEKNIKNDSVHSALRSAKKRGHIILKGKYTTDKYNVILTADDVFKILYELGDLFCSKGLDDNSEPNQLGLLVESLIDIFNR